jgi:hypothetical protein
MAGRDLCIHHRSARLRPWHATSTSSDARRGARAGWLIWIEGSAGARAPPLRACLTLAVEGVKTPITANFTAFQKKSSTSALK